MVFYFRGLNSQGDDQLRFGKFRLGPMHQHLQNELAQRQIELIPVVGMGRGRLSAHVERAVEFIEGHSAWREPSNPIHFLGHSTGGLIARATLHQLSPTHMIHSVVTLATPHQGAALADHVALTPEKRPLLHRLFQSIGYDVRTRLESFVDLKPSAVQAFNQRYPNLPGVQYASLVFESSAEDLSWPLKILNHAVMGRDHGLKHDGVVESASQAWGKVLFTSRLDHMNQIGYNLRLRPDDRRRTRIEFLRLCDALATFWQELDRRDERSPRSHAIPTPGQINSK